MYTQFNIDNYGRLLVNVGWYETLIDYKVWTLTHTYLFRPNELDAVVYGHLFTILTTSLPQSVERFAEIVREFPNLVDFATRVDDEYFKETLLNRSSSNVSES